MAEQGIQVSRKRIDYSTVSFKAVQMKLFQDDSSAEALGEFF